MNEQDYKFTMLINIVSLNIFKGLCFRTAFFYIAAYHVAGKYSFDFCFFVPCLLQPYSSTSVKIFLLLKDFFFNS